MIGNDVVDIIAARRESRWQREGFLQKLFTPVEQKMILCCNDPEIILWTLWSMKEAAYKIYNRETGIRAFIPHLLMCNLNISDFTGSVFVHKKTYYTKTVINNYIIDTVAVTDPSYLKNIRQVDIKKVFKDEYGLPYFITPAFNKIPVSVSHHSGALKAVLIDLS